MNKLQRTTRGAVRLALGLALAATIYGPQLIHDSRLMHRQHPSVSVSHKKPAKRAPVQVIRASTRVKLQVPWVPDPATIKARDKLLASAHSSEAQAGRIIATGKGTIEETRLLIHDYDQAAVTYAVLNEPGKAWSDRQGQYKAAWQLPDNPKLAFWKQSERDEQVGLALREIRWLEREMMAPIQATGQ